MSNKILLSVVLACAMSVPANAQDKKPGLPPGDTFFTIKGRPYPLERSFPGIHAALGLTDEQKREIAAARAATIGSDAVRAHRNLKGDPTATEAQFKEAARVREEAQKQLQEKVDAILTADQKKLIAQIQDAVTKAQAAAASQFEGALAGAKGDDAKTAELRVKVQDEARLVLREELEKILTAQQRAAVDDAALEAREAEERAAKAKGVK